MFKAQPLICRSALFVPANRPERIPKALAAGADRVIVDLEDAVAPEAKDTARDALGERLDAGDGEGLWVRINAPDTLAFETDLAFCREHPALGGIVVAKAETEASLERVAALGLPIVALIESAAGLAALPSLSRVEGVERLSFGALDLSLDLGGEPGSEGGEWLLDQVRYSIVLHSRLAGLAPPLETVLPDFRDLGRVERVARRAAEMGFGGMLCIHPQQVDAIHRGMAPSEAQCDWARRVLAATEQRADATQVDGEMIDAPVIERARRLLARLVER
ncbi:HpcH/HpaI aldolase/citrate lyase family protein [Salinicola aestuarinus]|uniref:HpcH/HpaI aldolase/citrate lyase family protein n=1 Tax=Salinicola aestuarinus TaxID=1949082 RepID=UPI000DA1EAAC|nr:CoA ester lyase [Salinicola aestuarinus]